jgi:hypothetical protein
MSRGRRRDAPEPPPASVAAPRGAARVATNAFIAGFLLLQLFLPLRYHATGRGSDERFAWRFFSSVGLRRCEIRIDEVVEGDGVVRRRAVHLPSELSSVWIGLLKSDRPRVVARFLERRCEAAEATEVIYHRACTDPDGRVVPPRELVWECARGEARGGSGA